MHAAVFLSFLKRGLTIDLTTIKHGCQIGNYKKINLLKNLTKVINHFGNKFKSHIL